MSKVYTDPAHYAAIAAAIREVGGSEETYTPAEMAPAIRGLSPNVEPLNVTENGTYTAPAGGGYSPVVVDVSSGGRLPAGYTELPFLDSDGTQYIDTGVQSVNGIEIKFRYKAVTSNASIYGARDSSDYNRFGLIIWNSGFHLMPPGTNISNADTNVHTLTYGEKFAWKATLDGSVLYTSTDYTYSSYAAHLFGHNWAGSDGNRAIARIFYAKIYQGDTLAGDFVPCMRDSDSELGMFDLVGNQFFGDAAGGHF